MSWKSGTELFDSIITVIKKEVQDYSTRKKIYSELIGHFQCHDWCNARDCVGEDRAYDDAYRDVDLDPKDKEAVEWFETDYEERWNKK